MVGTRYLFLVDQNLPPALVAWLGANNAAGIHVRNVGLREADDRAIAERAVALGAILITNDSDFVDIRWRVNPAPRVVLIRLGNAPNSKLLPWLEKRWANVCAALASDTQLIELIQQSAPQA